MRRSKALDAPALLVDQDRGLPVEHVTHLVDQAAQLLWRSDVAPEHDQPPRLRPAKKSALAIG